MYEIDRVLIAKSKKSKKKILSLIWRLIKGSLFKRSNKKLYKFSGWGMDINHSDPPWETLPTAKDKVFEQINNLLLERISNKEFCLTQFDFHNTNYSKILEELKWRHYLLYNACNDIIKNSNNKKKNLVECGVCDGLTFYIMAQCFNVNKIEFQGYLYDSWSKFNFDNKKDLFDYSYLNLEITKKNLKQFERNIIFNEGNIPEVFDNSENPKSIDLLHLDLNSGDATRDALMFFYDKINSEGIIIFDDYGRMALEKQVIDEFFLDKQGNFISFPTGQAIFIKS